MSGNLARPADRMVLVACEHDRELWLDVRAGSSEAFGVLFERHARAVYNYCFRRTADWAMAEDLTSAVFLEAWRRRHEIAPPDMSILPWLFGVATNLLRNVGRTRRRYRHAIGRLPQWVSDPDFSDDVVQRLDAERSMRLVLEQLRHLPPHERDVLALCVWMGTSYEDAAAALGVPVGTVRSRLSRARARLRELAPLTGQDEVEAGDSAIGRRPCDREVRTDD